MTDAVQGRVRGLLHGLAAGDRIGGPLRTAGATPPEVPAARS
jgi:hypothetical protein